MKCVDVIHFIEVRFFRARSFSLTLHLFLFSILSETLFCAFKSIRNCELNDDANIYKYEYSGGEEDVLDGSSSLNPYYILYMKYLGFFFSEVTLNLI